MPIENDIARIATALERILEKFDHIGQVPEKTTEAEPAKKVAPPKKTTKVAPPPKKKPAAIATEADTSTTKSSSEPACADITTAEELNKALIIEHERLNGNMQVIFDVINKAPYNAVGVRDVDPSLYSSLVADVRKIEAA